MKVYSFFVPLLTSSYRTFFFFYLLVVLSLFFYSFTQVDLSLTLSRASILQDIQKAFQYVGYFNRPVATYLYIGIVFFLWLGYARILLLVKKKALGTKELYPLIVLTTLFLTFSYTAFSHDIFNYIFDAKIVTAYQENPYQHKALDYPSDPMLSFMHWTHRTYPYGPIWLVLTVPVSFLGLQYFLPTYFLFKMLMAGAFLLTLYWIEKIGKTYLANGILPLAFFAFNPLVLMEALVAGHNDLAMMALAVIACFSVLQKEHVKSFAFLLLSIGVKFASGVLLPLFLLYTLLPRVFGKNAVQTFLLFCSLLLAGTVIAASYRTNFQPWYLLFVLPFAALQLQRYYIAVPAIVLSLIASFYYTAYFYQGDWNEPVPSILSWMLIVGIGLSVLMTLGIYVRKSK